MNYTNKKHRISYNDGFACAMIMLEAAIVLGKMKIKIVRLKKTKISFFYKAKIKRKVVFLFFFCPDADDNHF